MWVAFFLIIILSAFILGFYVIYPVLFSIFVTIYGLLCAIVVGIFLTPCLIVGILLFFLPLFAMLIIPCILLIGVPGFIFGILDAVYAETIISKKYGLDPIQMKLLLKDLKAGKLRRQPNPVPSNQNPSNGYGSQQQPQFQQQQQFNPYQQYPQQQRFPQQQYYQPPSAPAPQQQQYYPPAPAPAPQPQYYAPPPVESVPQQGYQEPRLDEGKKYPTSNQTTGYADN